MFVSLPVWLLSRNLCCVITLENLYFCWCFLSKLFFDHFSYLCYSLIAFHYVGGIDNSFEVDNIDKFALNYGRETIFEEVYKLKSRLNLEVCWLDDVMITGFSLVGNYLIFVNKYGTWVRRGGGGGISFPAFLLCALVFWVEWWTLLVLFHIHPRPSTLQFALKHYKVFQSSKKELRLYLLL